METEKKLKKVRIRLLLNAPFFGNLAMNLRLVEDNGMPFGTMAVDHEGTLYYSKDIVDTLQVDELEFVLCHEVLHLALNHLTRRGGREPFIWGIACDLAVNSIVVNAGIGTMPGGIYEGIRDPKYDGWSAEKIYNALPDLPREWPVLTINGHECCRGRCWDYHMFPGIKDFRCISREQNIDQAEKAWKNAVARAATVARTRGSLPYGMTTLIDGLIGNQVDWRTVLWQFVNKTARDDFQWYPQNRRHIHSGIYLPSMRTEGLEIAVAVDTSGSISERELKQFLTELQGILDMNPSCKVHFYECDMSIQSYKEYRAGDKIETTIIGRGGTDFAPVFEDIGERGLDIDCLVYLTDACGTFPGKSPCYEVLWVLPQVCRGALFSTPMIPFGETIRITIEEEGGQ